MSEEEKNGEASSKDEPRSPRLMDEQLKMRGDIILSPQPSDDDADPLNWSLRKKYLMLGILSLAAFSQHVASLANQLGYSPQASLYHKSLNDMADTIAICISGLAAGPLLLMPLIHVFGCCSIVFWSLIGGTCCGIWSALMTNSDQYVAFAISRFTAGFFSATPTILGPQMLVEIFFLHERGKVFNTFMQCSNLGVIIGPTLGGYMVQHAPWPWLFWYTVILQGVVAVLVFLFLEESGFTRKDGNIYPRQPSEFIQNRIATYFPGTRVAHEGGLKAVRNSVVAQVLIGITPVTILAGLYLLALSGWFVGFNTLLSVFLQEPIEAGGYGFTAQETAGFTFTLWIASFAAQLWGHLFNDRIPLYFVAKNSGTWKPEYRLHALWVPSVLIMPIGLGIVGVALQYHLHYAVLALGTFLVTLASICITPIAINYLVECFLHCSTEMNCILGIYRLGLGLAIPFFINAWVAKVGVGWVFGIQAILTVIMFVPIVILMLYGHTVRQLGFEELRKDEEGTQVIRKEVLVDDRL